MTTSHGGAGIRVVGALAVLSAGAALAWMMFLPDAVGRVIRQRTGFGVTIQSLYCNPVTANLDVRGLVVTNPPGFPQQGFLTIRELRLDARPASFFGNRWVVDDAAADIAEVVVIRGPHGRVNVRLFREGLAGSGPAAPAGAGDRTRAGPTHGFLIRHLVLRVDRVVVTDYARREPDTRVYDLRFRHDYANVTSAGQLVAPLAEALGNLTGTLEGMMPGSDGWVRQATGSLQEAGRKTGEAIKGLFESLEKRIRK